MKKGLIALVTAGMILSGCAKWYDIDGDKVKVDNFVDVCTVKRKDGKVIDYSYQMNRDSNGIYFSLDRIEIKEEGKKESYTEWEVLFKAKEKFEYYMSEINKKIVAEANKKYLIEEQKRKNKVKGG